MTGGRIILPPTNPSLDSNGDPAASSTITVYQNLTTTLVSIYSNAALSVALANPLTCDAAGRFPQIWAADGNYSVKWSPTGGSPVTYDDIATQAPAGSIKVNTVEEYTTSQGVAIKGVSDGSSKAAGYVGELLSNTLASGSATALVTDTAKDVVFKDFTAGEWEVSGIVVFGGNAATTVSYIVAAISQASATLPTIGTTARQERVTPGGTPFATSNVTEIVGPVRFRFNSTTRLYLVAKMGFAVNTGSAFGEIRGTRL